LDVFLLLVDVGKTPGLLKVKFENDEIFLHRVVHHIDLALLVPDPLLDADEIGHGRLNGFDKVVRQVGDQSVVPLEWRHQGDQRQHNYGKIGGIFLYDNYLFLKQQSPYKQQDLVNVLNLVEEARKVKGFCLELAIILVDVSEVEFGQISLPVMLVAALQRHSVHQVLFEGQVLEQDGRQELIPLDDLELESLLRAAEDQFSIGWHHLGLIDEGKSALKQLDQRLGVST
jgi:hypothetical protein